MKTILYFTLLASFVGVCAGDFKIFYTPFDAKTSDVINVKNVEKTALVVIFVAGTFEADDIVELITPSQEIMKKNHLRLKIIACNNVYYFDANGVGLKNGKERVCIDKKKFDKIISWNGMCFRLNDESKLK